MNIVIVIDQAKNTMTKMVYRNTHDGDKMLGLIQIPIVSVEQLELDMLKIVRLSGKPEYYETLKVLDEEAYCVRKVV